MMEQWNEFCFTQLVFALPKNIMYVAQLCLVPWSRGLRVTKNTYFYSFLHTKQLLKLMICDKTAGIWGSFQTHGNMEGRTKCPFGRVWGLSDPGEIRTPDSFGEQFCWVIRKCAVARFKLTIRLAKQWECKWPNLPKPLGHLDLLNNLLNWNCISL